MQEAHLPYLRANKKSADAMIAYLQSHYPVVPFPDSSMLEVTRLGALEYRRSLGINAPEPDPVAFQVENTGTGAELYRTQKQDYTERIRQVREWYADAEDLPDDAFPHPVVVGIDRVSGHISVEGSPRLDDELFLFQGFSSTDLENPWLVYRYVTLACQD